MEVPALKGGVLKRRLKNEGDVVKVDELLGELDETAVPAAAPASAPAEKAAAAASGGSGGVATAPAPARTEQRPPVEPAARGDGAEVKSSPAARRVAAEEGVDLSAVSGSGRGGVVSKPDVVGAAASRGS